MFQKITPQKVHHSDGYTVQVSDRYSVEYFDEACQARIEVDFGANVGVYARTLIVKDRSGVEISPTEIEKTKILERVVAGIEAMGSKVEYV